MSITSRKIKLEVGNLLEIADIFIVLNLFGYSEENNPKGMSALRKKLRKEGGKVDFSKRYPILKRMAQSYHPWHLINFVLAEKAVERHQKFYHELKKFSSEPIVRKYRKLVVEEGLKSCDPLTRHFLKELTRIFDFLSHPKVDFDKIVLMLNPLDAYWRGYSFKAGKSLYLIAGPGSINERINVLSHELFHALTNNYHLPKSFPMRVSKKMTLHGYVSAKNISNEYVVRALNLVYLSRMKGEKYMTVALNDAQKDFPDIKEAVIYMENKVGRYNVR
jgi:hypothetical protein